MARSFRCRILSLILVSGAVGAGCQSTTSTAVSLPGPNFEGPVVVQAYQPPVITKQVEISKPTAPKPIDGPAAWLPVAGAQKREWNWIVIHHSATPNGGAERFDREHRKKWDELGYHFVIGNGTDTADGLIEVGSRWPVQKHGAHAKTLDNRYNEHGIGICLVGNFEEGRPTAKQMASLTKLVTYLADKYRIGQRDIITHKMTGKSTECPGKYLDIAAVRATVEKQRTTLVEEKPLDTGELIQSASR